MIRARVATGYIPLLVPKSMLLQTTTRLPHPLLPKRPLSIRSENSFRTCYFWLRNVHYVRGKTIAGYRPPHFAHLHTMPKNSYSAAQRRDYVHKLLQEQGHVSVSSLSEDLGVSEVTIRKDLSYLEDYNLLVRTHGGAILPDRFVYDRPFEEKSKHHADEKRRIGKEAAALVKDDNDTLFLDAGTTIMQVAKHLTHKKNLMVVTNAVNVALELLTRTDAEVLMLGGMLRSSSASVVGPFTEEMIKQYACSKLFLGVDGFDLGHGLTTTHPMEAHVNQLMIEASEQTVVVTDSSKFGRRGLSRICGIDKIDMVITDSEAPEGMIKKLEEMGVECRLV